MSERSVQRYLSPFHSTGSVAPEDSTGGPDKILMETEHFTVTNIRVDSEKIESLRWTFFDLPRYLTIIL